MTTYVYDAKALGLKVVKFVPEKLEANVNCPYHNEKTPSAWFNVGTGLFHCFGCDTNKNAEQLAMDLDGTIEKISMKEIVTNFHTKIKEDISNLHSLNMAIGNKYLISRLVNDKQVEEFSLKESSNSVLISVKNQNGITIGYQERKTDGSSPKYLFHGETSLIWPMEKFTEFLASDRKVCYLTEGVFGALRGRLYGYDTYASLGSTKANNILPFINNCVAFGKEVKICFDNDEAGILASIKLLTRSKYQCKIVFNEISPDELDENGWLELSQAKTYKTTKEIFNLFAEDEKLELIKNLLGLGNERK